MAGRIWIAIVCVYAATIAAAGIADLCLWIAEQQTITDWLRKHPDAFWLPCILLLAFLLWMGLHLFLWPRLP